ncbi:voltage-gated potassium channel [Aureococcus anophagefferens]|nr:voltage-gated potassium channel [Aureococcus anophagefferens]
MTARARADLVEKAVGSAASDGYLAFNLIYEDESGSLTSSWLVAMAYDGTVRTMTPLYEGDALHRAAGLKMWDDDELLLAVGKDTSLDGYAYKWNWRSGDYAKYSTKEIDIHDVQRANSGALFWALYHEEFAKVGKDGDVEVGWNAVEHTPSDDVWDLNHVQLIEDDDYAILSSRLTNTIYKVKAATGAKHNAEYIGDDEYAMFDNNYDFSSKESRLLIVKIDEAAKTANVTFDYSTGTYSQVFGDNDRMPTGNMLGCWWPSHTVTADDDACCKVYGKKTCESGTCDVEEGWLMYSVERFYEDPMVYDVDCGAERLSFATANTHKMASDSYGTYKLYDATGACVAYGDVTWKPHWQRSVVDVDYAISNSGTIEVENQYGSAGTWTFTGI